MFLLFIPIFSTAGCEAPGVNQTDSRFALVFSEKNFLSFHLIPQLKVNYRVRSTRRKPNLLIFNELFTSSRNQGTFSYPFFNSRVRSTRRQLNRLPLSIRILQKNISFIHSPYFPSQRQQQGAKHPASTQPTYF